MKRAHDLEPDLPVIVLTGVGTVQTAVAAMKHGALDFLVKPVDPDALVALLRKAVSHAELVDEVRSLRAAVRELADAPAIVGGSAAMQAVLTLVKSVAASDARVLISGESGTGKELIAHAIHGASRRARKPFVRVNCAAIPETLFESEFFGHRRGAFTGALGDRVGRFAEAHGGTIALDEVGTLSLDAQAKLLRVLETGEYQPVGESKVRVADARVIAITNEDLDARVKQKSFREDLYYRLKVLPIVVPPLRARKEDIPALAAHLLENLARRDGTAVKRVAPAAVDVLTRYDWPGNVRELRNALERAALMAAGDVITADEAAGILEGGMVFPAAALSVKGSEESLRIRERSGALEKQLILEALRRTRGRKGEACALLGIDASNFAYYVKKHQLTLDMPPKGEGEA
jgi:DNA-binding NtrC family response regulator